VRKQLRDKISNYLLGKEIRNSKRQAVLIPFTDAKNIGILYDATLDKDYELIKNYVKDIRALSKDVIALGFYNGKDLPGSRLMKLGLDFFSRNSLSWKQKPNNAIVNNFMNRHFDILICLSLDRSIPLRYVASNTKAKFKIGKYDPASSGIFDFMIKSDGDTNLKQMIEQVNHYINLIRNETYEKA
jgi:hypothetical protein